MIKIRILALIGVSVILILAVNIGMAEATRPESISGGGFPADHPWFTQTVESPSGGEVGQYASLAFHPGTAKPYISHYDATNGDLHLSYPTDVSGNCGPDNAWYCEVIDTAGDVGQYSSIDVYYNFSSNDRKIGIAYHDATNDALKVAIWSCPTLPPCGWTISTIQAGFGGLSSFGSKASLKFDSNGGVHIAYYNWNSITDDRLMYAYYVGSAGNCGEAEAAGEWQCLQVDNGNGVGSYPSLDVTTDDHPVIAHYVPATTSAPSQIRICSWQSTWDCRVIDAGGGTYPSLDIDNNNHIQIAYYDAFDDTLKYAKYVGSGGNCGLNSSTSQYEYQCDTITYIGDVDPASISLATEMTHPIIAYQNDSDPQGFPTLDIARPMNVYAGKVVGNCGPLIGIIPQWQCDTLDSGGYLYEAEYVSVDTDITNLAAIAYYEYDDYYNEGRLKFAYQQRVYEAFLPMTIR